MLPSRDGGRGKTASSRLEDSASQEAKADRGGVAKSARALGLVRQDPEATVTRTFAGNDDEDGERGRADDDDFDDPKTLARRPEADMSEPETLARRVASSSDDRSITDDETITRHGSKVLTDETEDTLTTRRPPEPETIPRSDRARLDAPNTPRRDTVPPPPLEGAQANARLAALAPAPSPWATGAIDPTPPPPPTIRTPLAMVTAPEDNLTRVAPMGGPIPPAAPHLHAPSGPIPYLQPPPPSAAAVTIQRAVLFVSATLLVAVVVFFVLRPRTQPAPAAASRPPAAAVEQVPAPAVTSPPVAAVIAPPVEPAAAVEQVPAPAVTSPPVAAVIAPPVELTTAPSPTTTAQPPATRTAAATKAPAPPSTTASTSHHGTPRRKHVKHRVPTRRAQ